MTFAGGTRFGRATFADTVRFSDATFAVDIALDGTSNAFVDAVLDGAMFNAIVAPRDARHPSRLSGREA